jgi:very-short-patch-repair endonuclease
VRDRNEKSIRLARRLRVNQTHAETVLWNRIRNRQIDRHKFVRQQPISGYICDFVCRKSFWSLKSTAGNTTSPPPTQFVIVA